MSDDLSKVDWGKPIEAVNDCDGRVVGLTLASSCPDKLAYYQTTASPAGDANCYWNIDGSSACNPNWRIRNVAEPDMGNPITDNIAKRMEADQQQAVFRICEAAAALNVATDGMTILRAEREAVVAALRAVRDSHALLPATTDRLRRALERDSREG